MQELSLEPGVASSTLASSGTLWWRSELRRRSGAVERMARPVAFAEKFALASIVLSVLGLAAWQWNQITGWLSWLVDLPNANGSRLDDPGVAAASMPGWMPILLMASIGGFILVWGFALFLLARRD